MYNYSINHIRKSPHRNSLEKYLRKHLPKLEGRILDIGSKNRRYDYLLKSVPVAVDLVENVSKNVTREDVNNLSFENDSFEGVLCLEVLEYVDTPQQAFSEVSRVLKTGGTLILSVPFMYREHDDLLRYTKKYLITHLSKEFSEVECMNIGNPYSIVLDMIKDKINKISFTPLRYLVIVLYLPFAFLGDLVPYVQNSRYVSGYFIVAKK